jgi:hypothetical protein
MMLTWSLSTTAQARIGSSLGDIYSEFSDDSPSFKDLEGGRKSMRAITDRGVVDFVFNTEQICVMTLILPSSQGNLNYYVETYNSRYVIISSKEWRMYASDGAIARITMETYEDKTFFMWTSIE